MCIFHKWTKWTAYEEQGVAIHTKSGSRTPYTEVRQFRSCQRCNFQQDRFIKDGPLIKLAKLENSP